MANWYVSTTGVSGNTGAIGSPWDIVSAAAGHSGSIQPGDTVWCRGGAYNFTDTTLNFTASGNVGSGADNPDGKIIYRGYRSTTSDVSTLERAKFIQNVTTVAASAGAVTANATAPGAVVSVTKATNHQALAICHQITIASGPAAGVYVVAAGVTLVAGTPTNISIVPNLRGTGTAGGETVTLALDLTGGGRDLIIRSCSFMWLMDLDLSAAMPYRTREGGGPTGDSNFGNVTDGNRLINCFVHELSGGTNRVSDSGDDEQYGNLFMYQGFSGMTGNPGDGGGHHVYIHHKTSGGKRLKATANCMFGDEGIALQCFDAAGPAGFEQDIDVTDNICALSGQLNNLSPNGGKYAIAYALGGDQVISGINFQRNINYWHDAEGDAALNFGGSALKIGPNIVVTDNFFHGGGGGWGPDGVVTFYPTATIATAPAGSLTFQRNTIRCQASNANHNGRIIRLLQAGGAGYTWGGAGGNENKYYRPLGAGGFDCGDETGGGNPFAFRSTAADCRTLAQFITDCSFGANADTISTTDPAATIVLVVRRDKYDPGQCWITYFNYASLGTIPVTAGMLSGILNSGDTYMVHDIRAIWAGVGGEPGSPVAGPLVWNGTTINLPTTQVANPSMSGAQWGIGVEIAPVNTAPFHNTFLLRRTAVGTGGFGGSFKSGSRGRGSWYRRRA